MKLTRKLIPALAMLLISAVLMSTASFAWFSMNETVEATGMKVTATSEFIFLEISGTEDDGKFTTKGTNAVNASLLPVAHETFSDANAVKTPENWYYQFSNDPAKHEAADPLKKEALTAENFGKFVATSAYQIKLHEGQLETGYDLHVSSITIPAGKGITVVIVGANGYQEFSATDNEITYSEAAAADGILSDTVGLTEQTITAYIFFNGDDENVYTNNIKDGEGAANLVGDISFKITAYAASHT